MDEKYLMYQDANGRHGYDFDKPNLDNEHLLEGTRILHKGLPGHLSETIKLVCDMLNHEYDCFG